MHSANESVKIFMFIAMDEAILAAAENDWTKISMVIVRAARAIDGVLPVGPSRYEQIGRRVEALVAEGRLDARGKIESWRYSEVRRAEK